MDLTRRKRELVPAGHCHGAKKPVGLGAHQAARQAAMGCSPPVAQGLVRGLSHRRSSASLDNNSARDRLSMQHPPPTIRRQQADTTPHQHSLAMNSLAGRHAPPATRAAQRRGELVTGELCAGSSGGRLCTCDAAAGAALGTGAGATGAGTGMRTAGAGAGAAGRLRAAGAAAGVDLAAPSSPSCVGVVRG